MPLSTRLALFASGLLLLVGMLGGAWKFWQIATRPERRAHPYVDILHRAALLYSFAALVLAALAQFGDLSEGARLLGLGGNGLFFAFALATYAWHGWREDTTNQLDPGGPVSTTAMVLLILAEVGGLSLLLFGFARAQLFTS